MKYIFIGKIVVNRLIKALIRDKFIVFKAVLGIKGKKDKKRKGLGIDKSN